MSECVAVALWRNRDEDFGLEVGLHRNYGSLKGQLGLDVDVEIETANSPSATSASRTLAPSPDVGMGAGYQLTPSF